MLGAHNLLLGATILSGGIAAAAIFAAQGWWRQIHDLREMLLHEEQFGRDQTRKLERLRLDFDAYQYAIKSGIQSPTAEELTRIKGVLRVRVDRELPPAFIARRDAVRSGKARRDPVTGRLLKADGTTVRIAPGATQSGVLAVSKDIP